MTIRVKTNHYNVKFLKGYGFSIKVKDSKTMQKYCLVNLKLMIGLGIALMIIGFIIIISFFAVSKYYMVGVSDLVILIGIAVLVIGFITFYGWRKKVLIVNDSQR